VTTTTAAVAEALGREGDAALISRLEATVAAVNALVEQMATSKPPARALGAQMLAVRLWSRRNSPEGVATFTADGAVYVQRNDPDIALLLGIGPYAPPVVG